MSAAAATVPAPEGDAEICFVLHAGGGAFAAPVRAVQAIVRVKETTPVPLGPPVIAGLVNLRGRIVIAMSLVRRLGGEAAAPLDPAGALAVAVEHGSECYALLVEDVGDVTTLSPSQQIRSPVNAPPDLARVVRAWYRAGPGILPLLDLDALFAITADRRSGFDRRASPIQPAGGPP